MTIEEVVAKQEITELSAKYMRGLDRLDKALMQSVFFADATVDYGFFKGNAIEFVDFAQEVLKDHAVNHHMIGQVLITLESKQGGADTAFGEVYFQAYHRVVQEDKPVDLLISGRYLDRYEYRDSGWKIAFRCEVNDWSRTDPAADEYMQSNTEGLVSGRQNDLSYDTAFMNQR